MPTTNPRTLNKAALIMSELLRSRLRKEPNLPTGQSAGFAISDPLTAAGQDVIPNGVLLNPAGRVATQEELASAPKDDVGNAIGYRRVYLEGEARDYSILRNSQANIKFLSDIRSSFGAEVRIQMPVINVPFRLIFAYNPQAKTDLTDPKVLFIERRTAVRFSVGRTF